MEEPQEAKEILEVEEDVDVLGLYLAEVARTPVLTEAEEKELVWRMQQGDRLARERLIISHLRLVVSLAKEYGDTGLDLLDLIQEGNIGLIEAVDRYDPRRGVRLSTYARWWIRQAIGQAIERQSQLIRIPAYLFRAIIRFQRLKAGFGAEGIEESEDILVAPGLTPERLLRVHETVGNVISLDTPLDEEEGTSVEELVADEEMPPPERAALLELFREELLDMVEKLPARDAQVLRWRYGLEGPRPLTLAEIGEKLGISRERVRQLEERALKRLKEIWGEKALEFYRRLLASV
ncbi:MAG: sigma-70 family RNA polymerase sigma factor [Candidatus Bipolaricaulaceae bacterium]